jgi:GMP synthase (glutamine-hydrolysing)
VRILVVRHADGGDPGILAERALAAGHQLQFCAPHAGEALPDGGYDAIVVLGGSVNITEGHDFLAAETDFLASATVPVLGVCLGAQLLAASAGARVQRASEPEIGWFDVRLTDAGRADPLLGALPERFTAYQWHSYAFDLPEGAVPLAASDACPQAFRLGDAAWGVQFHPEVNEKILEEWFGDYRSDADAVRLGFDPQAARAELPAHLPAWNAIGARLFDRFLEVAARVGQAA